MMGDEEIDRTEQISYRKIVYQQTLSILQFVLSLSVCLATFAQCSSQLWLNRVGRCIKLIAPTRGRPTFCHEFASQFGLDFFYTQKKPQTSPRPGRMLQRHRPSERRNLKRSLYLHARWRLTSAAAMVDLVGAPKPPV